MYLQSRCVSTPVFFHIVTIHSLNRAFLNDFEKGWFREWFYLSLSQTFKIHREGFLANGVIILNTFPDQVVEITTCPWITWGLHIPLSKMAWLLFIHIVPVVFRDASGLVVIHVIRFQWSDNNLPNTTYYMKKGKQINLSCQPQHQHTCLLPGTPEAWKSSGLFLIHLTVNKTPGIYGENTLDVRSSVHGSSAWDPVCEGHLCNQARNSLLLEHLGHLLHGGWLVHAGQWTC